MSKANKKVEVEIVPSYGAAELIESGAKKGEVIEYLIRKENISYAKAEEFWSKEGARAKTRGFRNLFYAKLVEGDLTDPEVKAFAKENGSPNDYKQYSHYVAIAEVVAKVRANAKKK